MNAPFQYALSTRAGTDCVGHMLRVATDLNGQGHHLSVDASVHRSRFASCLVGAFGDHASRSMHLTVCVCFNYAESSQYSWWDDEGRRRAVFQVEGGEQGDPLMPLLLQSVFRVLWRRSQFPSNPASNCAHFWTTCTLCAVLNVSKRSMTNCQIVFGVWPANTCTRAKPGSGTRVGSTRRGPAIESRGVAAGRDQGSRNPHWWRKFRSGKNTSSNRDVLLPARPTSGVIQGGMLVWYWRTAQQHLNSPSHRICSGRCCSKDCGSLSSSQRQRAKDARLPWT